MFLIKIYIKESYINYYHTIIQMCGQYCILAPISLTSVHHNLEHGLAILTESFSPLRSVLHNLSY